MMGAWGPQCALVQLLRGAGRRHFFCHFFQTISDMENYTSSSSSSSKRLKLPAPPADYICEPLLASALLSQGAEGKVYTGTYLTFQAVIKERQAKLYRVPALDARINKQRLLQEARCMAKCLRAGVLTPLVYMVDQQSLRIYMERIEGRTVKALLKEQAASGAGKYSQQCQVWAKLVGQAIGRMHDADIVHGDLTTSNIMIRAEGMHNPLSDDPNPLSLTLTLTPTPTLTLPDNPPSDPTAQPHPSTPALTPALPPPPPPAPNPLITPALPRPPPPACVLIDFGLGTMQANVEDQVRHTRTYTYTHVRTGAAASYLCLAVRVRVRAGARVKVRVRIRVRIRVRARVRAIFCLSSVCNSHRPLILTLLLSIPQPPSPHTPGTPPGRGPLRPGTRFSGDPPR